MSDKPKAEPTPAPTTAPKRSFFKKSAWQTAIKSEGAKQDIFSHSNDYANIVAEKARRKKEEEERKREEEAKKEADIKSEKVGIEEHDRKRRKVSAELESPNSASRGSSKAIKGEDKKHIQSSRSPGAKPEPSTTRYASMTRSGSSVPLSKKPTQIIEIDDPSDSDDTHPQKKPIPSREPMPSLDLDEDDPLDPDIAAIIADIRAKHLNPTPSVSRTVPGLTPNRSSGTPTPATEADKQPIVSLFIESELPDTKPVLIHIRISDTLKKPRLAWCTRHNFPPEVADNIFLTWRGERVWDSTSIARLGVTVDPMGYISVKGDDNIYMDDEPPKIHLQAWTEELWEECKREEEAEAAEAARLRAVASMSQYEQNEIEEQQPVEKKISLVLKAKGLEDFKIKVNPSTSFEHLASAYREKRHIRSDTAISLFFDGDRLKPMDIVADSEIEEMDSLEVHFN